MGRVRKILLLVLFLDLAFVAIFWGGSRLADQTKAISGGAGIVFYSDNGSDSMRRIEKGIALLEEGKVDQLIMVGGHRPQEGFVGSQQMALAAIRITGRSSQIRADVVSRDTFSGIANAEQFIGEDGKVVFVSNCMHVLRAKTVFSQTHQSQKKPLGACAKSSFNPFNTWRRAHYEAAAWGLYVMPESWREGIIDQMRGPEAQA